MRFCDAAITELFVRVEPREVVHVELPVGDVLAAEQSVARALACWNILAMLHRKFDLLIA
jgi:hypothetical protein